MPKTTFSSLDFLFHPRSVVLAGVTVSNPDHWTRTFLDALIDFKFEPLYLVNPKGGHINGRKVYASLKDIPDTVDHVISTVPASAAPALIKEAAGKGAKAVHFCTSGFSETGEEEGTRLEAELREAARKTGIRVIGPNCMGFYCPGSRLSFQNVFPKDPGPVGFVSQSGGNTTDLILNTMFRGVRFSKCISYGNAADLNECDFLEYLTDDPETSIINLYIEGIRDGRRFRQALERATRKKTVLLLKGGVSESGARAAVGHTGSLAGSDTAWESLCKQLGVIRVSSMSEMGDVVVTLLFMPVPQGRRVALIGFGGGPSVLIADVFEKNGFKVPSLPPSLRDEIRSFTPIAGNILRNPIDYSQSFSDNSKLRRTLELIAGWEDVDFIVFFMSPSRASPGNQRPIKGMLDELLEYARAAPKPFALVIEPSIDPRDAERILELIQISAASRVPIYFDFATAARAIDIVMTHAQNNLGKADKSVMKLPGVIA